MVKKLKFLSVKKNREYKFSQIELYTYGLSMLANPKIIFSSISPIAYGR